MTEFTTTMFCHKSEAKGLIADCIHHHLNKGLWDLQAVTELFEEIDKRVEKYVQQQLPTDEEIQQYALEFSNRQAVEKGLKEVAMKSICLGAEWMRSEIKNK